MNLFTSKVPVPEREREREREGKKIFEFSGSWQFSTIDRCEKGEDIDEKKRKKISTRYLETESRYNIHDSSRLGSVLAALGNPSTRRD